MKPPSHLSAAAQAVWAEVCTPDHTPAMAVSLEAYCVQIVRMRDAQERIDGEGLIIAGPKGAPQAHPALVIERQAGAEVERLAEVLCRAVRVAKSQRS